MDFSLVSVPGIGRAIATNLANSGADLAILDLATQDQSETKAACEHYNVKVYAYACDVTSEAEVQDTFAKIAKDLGPVEYDSGTSSLFAII